MRRLRREIALQGALFDRRRTVQQLHFGGGTPTYFSIAELGILFDEMREHFHLDDSEQREFSIEIDPRTVTAETFPGLAMLGFNRISLGVQDFDPTVQRAVNRHQSVQMVADCLHQARAAGFRSVSFDLIYGLPKQTLEGFTRTLDTVIDLRPDRIAVYGYAHMPSKFKAQRAIVSEDLPDAEARLQLLETTVERLTAAGYLHIGMDHFALPEDELCTAQSQGHLHRNFQGYSTRAECDLVGLGVSSIGQVGNAYAQNFKELSQYYAALDEDRLPIERGLALNTDDLVRREIIQQLMCHGKLDGSGIGARYALDFRTYFAKELRELDALQQDGLVVIDGETVTITERGRFLLRTIAMPFDAYLPQTAGKHSRVI
jgi:oxygen-independent coproporphyrinogen-3 oxidase